MPRKTREEKKAEKEAKKQMQQNANGDELDEEYESTGSKIAIGAVAVVIVVIWLAIIALLIKMDVGGFGSSVLYPVLKDVPVLNKILPEVEEYAPEDSAYNFATMSDAVARIKELEGVIANLEKGDEASASYIAELEAAKQELATYKANEAQFEEQKEKFYEEVVFSSKAPDIKEYKKYYEEIEPDNAEVLYKQVVAQTQKDKELEQYAKAYSSMKPAQAAEIFNTMTNDLKLVGRILWLMDADSRGKILGAMDADVAAKVTELMEP